MTARDWTHTVTGGPWPERIGLRCRIVPPQNDRYPWGIRSSREVVILIEDDPLDTGPVWSCALARRHITPIEAS